MSHTKHLTAKNLVRSVVAINVFGNLLGVVLTFIYFVVLMPRLHHGVPIGPLASTVGFFLVVMAFVMVFNTRIIWPLMPRSEAKTQSETTGHS